MTEIISFALFFVAYFVVMRYILPRFGVST